jgi:hypothetical protein
MNTTSNLMMMMMTAQSAKKRTPPVALVSASHDQSNKQFFINYEQQSSSLCANKNDYDLLTACSHNNSTFTLKSSEPTTSNKEDLVSSYIQENLEVINENNHQTRLQVNSDLEQKFNQINEHSNLNSTLIINENDNANQPHNSSLNACDFDDQLEGNRVEQLDDQSKKNEQAKSLLLTKEDISLEKLVKYKINPRSFSNNSNSSSDSDFY